MYYITLRCRLVKVFFWLISVSFYFVNSASIQTSSKIPDSLKPILQNTNLSQISDIINSTNQQLNDSRRILLGVDVQHGMPYVVYLKLPPSNEKFQAFRTWLCAGVIIYDDYIITSAACIEDAKHFYIVSGTSRFDPEDDKHTNLCIKNGARKAIWKCVPKNYVLENEDDDNIRWMSNDLAVVKVDEEFNFLQRVRGCEFTPKPVCYNNRSGEYEKPGGIATIAGWGSTDKYSDKFPTRRDLPYHPHLLKTQVVIISKLRCKAFWGSRYEHIIENYMICSSELFPHMSEICDQRYVDCMTLDEIDDGRRTYVRRSQLKLYSYKNDTNARRNIHVSPGVKVDFGGFCENDHGGPMLWGEGPGTLLIGIISACLVKDGTNKCKGPFLFTSVYKNRKLLDCAIFKDISECSKNMRAEDDIEETHISWIDHPDGPAKNEIGPKLKSEYKKVFSKEPSNVHERSTASPLYPVTAKEVQGQQEEVAPKGELEEVAPKGQPEEVQPQEQPEEVQPQGQQEVVQSQGKQEEADGK